MKNKNNVIYSRCLLTVIILGVYWRVFLPVPKVANDYHYLFDDTYRALFDLPYAWREIVTAEGLGEYAVATLWTWPISLAYGLFGVLGLDFSIATIALGLLITFATGLFSIWRLFGYLHISGWGRWIGSLFFLTNTYIVLLIDGGQLNLAMTYMLMPYVFYRFRIAVERFKVRDVLLFAFLVSAVAVFDLRVVLLCYMLSGISFFVDFLSGRLRRVLTIARYSVTGLAGVFFLAGINAFWIAPSLLIKLPSLPQSYGRELQVGFLSFSTLGHSLLLLQPHWHKNVFGSVSALKPEFFFVPVLAFLPPVLRRQDLWVCYWVFIALLGIFLSKGSLDPLPGIYPWLFNNLPGFSLFRDPVKFYFFTSLAYSVLVGFAVSELVRINIRRISLGNIVPWMIVLYLLFLLRPVYLGRMTGLLSEPMFYRDYFSLKVLHQDKSFSRIFWIPARAPLGFSSPTHPTVEASRLVQKRPFAIGTKGTYEAFNFLREGPFIGELFDVSGIGYIAYPPLDPRRDDMHPDNVRYYGIFLDQLLSLPWVEGRVEGARIPLLKVKEHQDRFFMASNLWWVIGSDDIYNEATKSAKLKLSKNALVFAEESPGLSNRISDFPEAKIVLNKKSLIDLAASFLPQDTFYFPAKGMDFQPDENGWWKREASDILWWREFLQTKYGIDNSDFDYGGGWAVGEGAKRLIVRDKRMESGKVLLARVLESSRGGKIRFVKGGGREGVVDTRKDGGGFRWFDVGTLGGGAITLDTEGEINVINALAFVGEREWKQYTGRARQLLDQGAVVDFDAGNAHDERAEVSYLKVNPTKYKVQVKGLNKPEILVLSQNYDSLWRLNGREGVRVYSLLNGFRVEKDGEYVVEFEAQRYVQWGFLVSGLSAVAFLAVLFIFRKRKPHLFKRGDEAENSRSGKEDTRAFKPEIFIAGRRQL